MEPLAECWDISAWEIGISLLLAVRNLFKKIYCQGRVVYQFCLALVAQQ